MSTLPTRIRQNIRDLAVSPTSILVARTTKLQEVLGYPTTIDPEWAMLWKTLQPYYSDPSAFVPAIVGTVISWCDAFAQWIENENEEGVEKMLDALKGKSRLELVLEIAPTSKRPTTAWSATKSVFIIALPKGAIPSQSAVLANFSTDFLSLFQGSPVLAADGDVSTSAEQDDWADLDLGAAENHPVALPQRDPGRLASSKDISEDNLPELATIPRPEELLRKAPYWLIVKQLTPMMLTVHCSHPGSLTLLEEYLRRWCRGDIHRANRPPVVEIKVHESAFGLGLLHDAFTMEAVRGREINAMLVLAFVEGVLGYTSVSGNGSAGSVWEFKRVKGFK